MSSGVKEGYTDGNHTLKHRGSYASLVSLVYAVIHRR